MTITLEQVVAEVSQIVSERPNYVYDVVNVDGDQSCIYFHQPEGRPDYRLPACVVGHWLARYHLDAARYIRSDDNEAFFVMLVEDVKAFGQALDITDDAKMFLREMQSSQDERIPWGRCLEYAKRVVCLA